MSKNTEGLTLGQLGEINAGLHAEVARLTVEIEYVSAVNTYLSRDVDTENPFETTDAILNEVRAQAVDDAFTTVIETCSSDDHFDEKLWNHGVLRVQVHMSNYAARIRAGEQS